MNISLVARCLLFSVAALIAAGQAVADPAKLDATLHRASESAATPASHVRIARSAVAASQPMVQATVHFSGSGLDEMRAAGVTIRSVLGDVATVEIPISRLAEIAALPGVVRIEAARRQVARLDRSVPATRADLLRSGADSTTWVGGTGKGVIVGIVDSGLDMAHQDFRKPDGTSRVLSFWNQRADALGTPPTSADGAALYGAACTQAMINQALAGGANGCNVADTGAHGTHVAGIAAGNGQATGNGLAGYRFVGVAPEADLIIANALDDNVTQNNAVLDAVAYMAGQAKALGRPIVINLSLGSYFGPRDGTSAYERALDNVSGAGVILVGAAGNEAEAKIRAVGTLVQGQSLSIGFSVPAGSISESLELWYDGANQYDVSLRCGSVPITPVVRAGDSSYSQDTSCGRITVTSTAPNPDNGDRQILVGLGIGTSNLASGAWALTLTGSVVGVNNRFSVISGETAQNINFTTGTETVTSEILTDTASARRVVAVASYNTRAQWSNAAGAYDAAAAGRMTGDLGNLSDFSSRGPRRMCSDVAKCPPIMKPEITAPGSYVMSAYSSKPASPEPSIYIDADGLHVAFFGTSMAAPHVTGAIALLLQAKPDLTPEDAKRILAMSVQGNNYTATTVLPVYSGADLPDAPNYAWGYGIMDIAKGFRSLAGNSLAAQGWHLLANTLGTPIDVPSVFADNTAVQSVWKWDAATNRWAFHSPSLSSAALASYAAGKGYMVLSAIQPGEGFWVNANSAVTIPVRGGQFFALDPSLLATGWNLVGTGVTTTPSAINTALTAKQQSALTTLWAWDNASAKWYFYAPGLDSSGGLSSYISVKGYLDFAAAGRTLGHGVGFWINR